ncbi:unnamed protein product [Discosporangium mesarthrocarpum]
MDFEDIYQVVPWAVLAYDLDIDPSLDQRHEPRCFKSHQLLSSSWRGARYLVAVRDPVTTLESCYAFQRAVNNKAVEDIDNIEDFLHSPLLTDDMMFGGSIWDYYRETWLCRHLPQVMVVVYEDMVKNLRGLLPKIANFMQLEPQDPAVLDKVAASCSKMFMMEHSSKFDGSFVKKKMVAKGVRAKPAARVLSSSSKKQRFSKASVEVLQRMWEEKMMPATGMATYEDFLKGLE